VLSSAAFAGAKAGLLVEINDDLNRAQGTIGAARHAKNEVEQIGCGISMSDAGLLWAFCNATAANGDYVVCTTTSAAFVDAIGAISELSYIRFFWTDDPGPVDGGTCSQINISNQSQYLRK
jgi:hypothetical protein